VLPRGSPPFDCLVVSGFDLPDFLVESTDRGCLLGRLAQGLVSEFRFTFTLGGDLGREQHGHRTANKPA
jgi:hypothetical protein